MQRIKYFNIIFCIIFLGLFGRIIYNFQNKIEWLEFSTSWIIRSESDLKEKNDELEFEIYLLKDTVSNLEKTVSQQARALSDLKDKISDLEYFLDRCLRYH